MAGGTREAYLRLPRTSGKVRRMRDRTMPLRDLKWFTPAIQKVQAEDVIGRWSGACCGRRRAARR